LVNFLIKKLNISKREIDKSTLDIIKYNKMR